MTDVLSPENSQERGAIRELICYERYCRDYAIWDEMQSFFAKGAMVKITWFQGTAEEFIERSKQLRGNSRHVINSVFVKVNQNRAAAAAQMKIESREKIHENEYMLSANVRMLYRLVKCGEDWKILSMEAIYEGDSLIPTIPTGNSDLDVSAFSGERKSYCCLSFVLKMHGLAVSQDLPGMDRPELVEPLFQEMNRWLYEKSDSREEKIE